MACHDLEEQVGLLAAHRLIADLVDDEQLGDPDRTMLYLIPVLALRSFEQLFVGRTEEARLVRSRFASWVVRKSRQVLPAIGAFAAALVVLSQGINAPFAGVQEPLQAQWIQDIISHGRWLVARDYYGLINLKPPLYFWLTALLADYAGGHVTEPLSRMVSLIAGALLATEVLLWTKANVGRLAGWFAYDVLLGSYGFASFATVNITDMLMSLLLFSAYCTLYPIMAQTESANRAALAGVLLGLAMLTKGSRRLLALHARHSSVPAIQR